ncbi:MAG: hypothetical protein GXO57_01560, partial [Thermodesulfobacteria bacterium]|nr:hypothetical protein [Thermodesulfobacteriota bacterium]
MKRLFSWLVVLGILLGIIGNLSAQEVQKYVLKLKKGEQFVSLPVAPSDNRIESIFGPILKYIVKIEYYDPEKGKWLCYIPSAVGEANSLKEIPAGSAFYIEVSNDTEVTIYGKPLEYGDYKLYPGWNAIGVPKEVTPAELDRGMADAKLKNRFVLGYDELYKESKPSERKRVAVGEKL